MASNEQENTMIKHRNSVLCDDIFSWKFSTCKENMEISSDIFYFCGYCCYLKFTYTVFSYADKEIKNFNIIISLHGYPSTRKKNISSKYSIFMKSDDKCPLRFNKTGEIQTLKEVINIVLFNEGYYCGALYPFSSTICFSWLENGDYEVFSQGTQTKPEKPIPVLERGTQTEGLCIPPTSKVIANAEKGSNKFLEILSKDLSSFYENKTDPDCVLKVNETEFPVHRSVLSSRSTVFAAMFHHDTSESQSGEVNILDVDSGALGDVLYYIYSGKVRGLCPETAVSMYVLSDKYALIDLREECLNFLTNNLTMDNICDAALLAHTHAETDLENKVLQFIEERLEELMQNDDWKKFSDTHFKLANYLICSAFKATKNKMKKISSNV